MFGKIREKMIERELHKLGKQLRQIDYTELKHTVMKYKWAALRANDDDTYNNIEEYEKLINVLEEIFGKKEVHNANSSN